jgi:hypothetical protein
MLWSLSVLLLVVMAALMAVLVLFFVSFWLVVGVVGTMCELTDALKLPGRRMRSRFNSANSGAGEGKERQEKREINQTTKEHMNDDIALIITNATETMPSMGDK